MAAPASRPIPPAVFLVYRAMPVLPSWLALGGKAVLLLLFYQKSWEHSREDCCSRGAQLVTIQANTTLVSAPSLACPASTGLSW